MQGRSVEGLLGKSFRSLFLAKLVLVECALVVLAEGFGDLLSLTHNGGPGNGVLLTEFVDDLEWIDKSDLVDSLHLDSVAIEKELELPLEGKKLVEGVLGLPLHIVETLDLDDPALGKDAGRLLGLGSFFATSLRGLLMLGKREVGLLGGDLVEEEGEVFVGAGKISLVSFDELPADFLGRIHY